MKFLVRHVDHLIGSSTNLRLGRVLRSSVVQLATLYCSCSILTVQSSLREAEDGLDLCQC